MKYFQLILLLFICLSARASDEAADVLDSFHQAAANADAKQYFDQLADNAIFLGTDGSERWSKSDFKNYVLPYFEKGHGWTYVATQRNISATAKADVLIFDELLENKSYGKCRGSGVLVKINHQWKIAQYNLSIPVPNMIASKIVEEIGSHRQASEKLHQTKNKSNNKNKNHSNNNQNDSKGIK